MNTKYEKGPVIASFVKLKTIVPTEKEKVCTL